MKHFLLTGLIGLIGIAQLNAASLVTGTWTRGGKKISLYEVKSGSLHEVATSQIGANNEFALAVNNTSSQFYVVGISIGSTLNNYVIYLKPNDQVNIAIYDTDYELVGKNTPENEEMARWYKLNYPLESNGAYFMQTRMTYTEFFPLLDSLWDKVTQYKPTYTKNKEFNQSFAVYRKFDVLKNMLLFISTPRIKHPSESDFTDKYNNLRVEDYTNDATYLQYPYAVKVINNLISFVGRREALKLSGEEQKKALSQQTSVDKAIADVVDPTIKGEILLSKAKQVQDYPTLVSFQEQYDKYFVNDDQRDRFKELLKAKYLDDKSQETFDFKFRNVEGKEIALSDFKGKVVYVDVWATWCGPCKQQIPYLKDLEKKYEGKNIVFLSVSVDSEKDHDKWATFIKDQQMGGVQLFAGDKGDDILGPYKITGIPRFMLFGTDGKIITANAPRPSTGDEIEKLLNDALK